MPSAGRRPSRLYSIGFLIYAGISAWAVLAVSRGGLNPVWSGVVFLSGAVLPGSLNSFLLESRSRKGVLLRAILFQMIMISTVWPRLPSGGWECLAVVALMGYAFALQQVTLASTLLNDLVVSEQRTCVDLEYAWICRAGLAAGMALAFPTAAFLPEYMYMCAGLPLAMAFLTALPLEVRLKAPVSVSLFSADRYVRADRMSAGVADLFVAFPLGFLLYHSGDVWIASALLPGVALAYLLRPALYRRGRVCDSLLLPQALTLAGLAVFQLPDALPLCAAWPAGFLTAAGVCLALSRILGSFLEESAHCRRGTSQHMHFLGALAGVTLGLSAGDRPLVAMAASVVVVASCVFIRVFRNYDGSRR